MSHPSWPAELHRDDPARLEDGLVIAAAAEWITIATAPAPEDLPAPAPKAQ